MEITTQPGESAEEITFTATVRATGLIYDRSEVQTRTTEFFQQSLQEKVPAGYVIDPSSVHLEEPLALLNAPTNVQFRVSGTATAYAQIDDSLISGLQSDLAGSSWSEAQARLDAVEQFESYEMSRTPSWWFERMPRDDERIDFTIIDQSQDTRIESPEATVGS